MIPTNIVINIPTKVQIRGTTLSTPLDCSKPLFEFHRSPAEPVVDASVKVPGKENRRFSKLCKVSWNNSCSNFWRSYIRLSKHVEHGDALGRLRGVQVVQCSHGVDNAKHHGWFHPVVHQVGIGQTGCKTWRRNCFTPLRVPGRSWETLIFEVSFHYTRVHEHGVERWSRCDSPRLQSESLVTSFMSVGMVRM